MKDQRAREVTEILKKEIDQLQIDILKLKNIVTCEKCKCLLNKEDAYRGKSIIKEKEEFLCGMGVYKTEYIHTPYYCLNCIPVEKEKDGTKEDTQS